MTTYAALAGRIRQTLYDLERVVARAELLADKAHQTSDDGYWDGVALNLHGFYSAAERIFEDIASETGEGMPQGPNWHQDLLLQMSATIDKSRPPVVSTTTRYCLDEYRSFRHLVRNVYAFNLRPDRLEALAKNLRSCCRSLTEDLASFASFLDHCDRNEG